MTLTDARAPRILASTLAAACLAFAPPEPPRCPSDARARGEAAKELMVGAQHSFEAGKFVEAADGYARAVQAYPECGTYHLRRITALEQASVTFLRLYADKRDNTYLERAIALLDGYLADLRGHYGAEAEAQEGFATASTLHSQLQSELDAASPAEGATMPETLPAETTATPPTRSDARVSDATRRLKLGASLAAGLAAASLVASLGMFSAVRRRGPLWDELYGRSIRIGAPAGSGDAMCANPLDDPEVARLCARRSGIIAGAVVLGVLAVLGASTAAVLGTRAARGHRERTLGKKFMPAWTIDRHRMMLGGAVRF